jgi:hypothetical protein
MMQRLNQFEAATRLDVQGGALRSLPQVILSERSCKAQLRTRAPGSMVGAAEFKVSMARPAAAL